MDDSIQAFIDQLRSLLQAPDPAQTAGLVAALARFGQYCEETNHRLRECLALISKGQYANAVELAERDPNLLDHCSLLDIPERDMLATVARSVSAPTPAVIGRELVEALQEAYQKGSTAAGNRRLLHKLALARAPLPARLAVMRRLAMQDPNHPFLDSDIRTFEKTWFKQAPAVAQRAASQGDVALIEELVDDLQNGGYLETPPPALMTPLQKALWKARTAMLPALAESIHSAFRDNAFAKLKELAAQWIIFAEGIPDASAKFQVADALDWFWQESVRQKQTEARNAARDRLSRQLQRPDATRAELESAYQSVVSVGGMDEGLEAQFRALVRRIERRRLAILASKGGIALAVVLTPVMALIFWAMSNAAHKRDVEALTTELTRLVLPQDPHQEVWEIKSADLKKARKSVIDSKPAVARDEKVKTLHEIVESELERREQLEAALAKIRDCPLGKDAGPLVAAARHFQKAADDETRIGEAEKEWQARSSKKIALFKQQIEDLLKRSNEVAETAKRGQAVAAENPIIGLRRDLESLQADARRIEYDDPLLHTIGENLEYVERWHKFAGPAHDFERTMRGAKLSAETLPRIAVHLKETIARLCPNRAAQANAELAGDSLESCNRLRELGLTLNLTGADAVSIDWPKLVAEWKETPVSAVLDVKERAAEALRQRNCNSQGTAAAQLREFLNQKYLARVWMLRNELSPEMRYYFLSEPTVNKQANFKTTAIVGPSGVTREVILAQKNYKKAVLAPQSVVARDALELWKANSQDAWNKSLADVFETLGRSKTTEAMDPLIKLRLVHDFLLLASRSSLGFRNRLEGLPEYKKLIADDVLTLTAGNWLDPREDDRLKSQREKAAQLLAQVPDLPALLPAVDAFDRRQADLAGQKDSVAWIGWLAPGERSPVAIVAFAGRGNLRPGKIYVMASGKFMAIGRVDGDKEVLDELAVEYLGFPALVVSEVIDK